MSAAAGSGLLAAGAGAGGRSPGRLGGVPSRVGGTRVSDAQRARILQGAVEVLAERGYGAMTVAHVTTRARVSRRTFYDLFSDRDDCMLALFDDAAARAERVAREAAAGEACWRDGIRAGLGALLVLAGQEPGLALLLVVGALGAGPAVLERRARLLTRLSAVIDKGRSEASRAGAPPALTAEGLVGAVLGVVHARLLARPGRRRAPVDLLNPLMAMIVLPYLGQQAAAEELARPELKMPARRKTPTGDPMRGLDMRMTYRTLRVLAAIAEHPGASNREVADAAGVADQGQMSKLLNRLEHLGLVENNGEGHAKGEPNAWTLTPRGTEINEGIAR